MGIRKRPQAVRSQVLYPAIFKGASERKVLILQVVSGVNSGSEKPFFTPK